MTDRTLQLTVVLDKEYRVDDAQAIIDAIQMVKGVLAVTPEVAKFEDYGAIQRAKYDLQMKLWDVVK